MLLQAEGSNLQDAGLAGGTPFSAAPGTFDDSHLRVILRKVDNPDLR
jgi:hypothetical protein